MRRHEALLLLPRVRVQNANAISSPLTWGFPAPTAFCGFTHALHRRLSTEYEGLAVDGTLIVCHAIDPQVTTPAGKRTKVFSLMRHPVDKAGKTAAIVEEGRVHLEVSLVIGLSGDALHGAADPEHIASCAGELTGCMRIAGGSVTSVGAPEIVDCDGQSRGQWRSRLVRRLLPGFALLSREADLDAHLQSLRQQNPAASALDALLDLTRLNIEPPEPAAESDSPSARWRVRSHPGWLVPIPVGFAALSELYPPGQVQNARDDTIPFRFVESILSLGEWVSPHRLGDLRDALWRYAPNPAEGLYRCTTALTEEIDGQE